MSKKQVWWLDINQVQRIKHGVLKYINLNESSKSRQRSSLWPSTPTSPMIKPKAHKLDKKQFSKIREVTQSSNSEKVRKKAISNKAENVEKMPKGYKLGSNGKIIRDGPQKSKKVQLMPQYQSQLDTSYFSFKLEDHSFEKVSKPLRQLQQKNMDTLVKERTKRQSNVVSISEQDIQLEAYDEILTSGINLFSKVVTLPPPNTIKEERKSIPKQKQVIQVKKQQKKVEIIVQEKKQLSVFQLAKMFGGNTSKKQVTNEISSNTSDKNRINKNVSDSDSKSNYSFGNIGIQNKDNLLKNENLQKPKNILLFQERRRSQTYQQQIKQSPLEESYDNNIQQNKIFQSTNTRQSQRRKYTTDRVQSIENQPQFKSISFTSLQSDTLKAKYKLLSTRLDHLKSKVIQESQHQIKALSPRSLHAIRSQIQTRKSMELYNRYSPLKKLSRKMKQKSQQRYRKQVSQTNPPRQQLSYYLRR